MLHWILDKLLHALRVEVCAFCWCWCRHQLLDTTDWTKLDETSRAPWVCVSREESPWCVASVLVSILQIVTFISCFRLMLASKHFLKPPHAPRARRPKLWSSNYVLLYSNVVSFVTFSWRRHDFFMLIVLRAHSQTFSWLAFNLASDQIIIKKRAQAPHTRAVGKEQVGVYLWTSCHVRACDHEFSWHPLFFAFSFPTACDRSGTTAEAAR